MCAHSTLLKMSLTDPIVSQGHCTRESPINDKNDWKTVSNAFSVIDFTEADLEVKALGFCLGGNYPIFLVVWSL